MSMAEYAAMRAGQPIGHPFRPYPKLWQYFADDPEAIRMLDSGLNFDDVTGLSKAMAMGRIDKQALRTRLKAIFELEEARWIPLGYRSQA